MKNHQKFLIIISVKITILIILTFLFSHFNLDVSLQQKFYRDNTWYLANTQPWLWFYEYGIYPSIIMTAVFLVFLLGSISIRRFVPYRRYALLVVLTLIIGPGLLINGIFKDWWGRPRPRQLQQFGGKWEFREVWQQGIPGKGKSFPCGHCSMGFHFVVVYYIFRNRKRIIGYGALGGSLIYGTLIGIGRMAQGGHFASDVLWSAGLTYLTATILYHIILKIPQKETVIKEKSMAPS